MAPTPALTTFDRSAMPSNLLTVAEWRTFARALLDGGQIRGNAGWEKAARHYADQVGGALVMLADDSLVVFTKLRFGDRAGRISRRTYRPGTWVWAA